MLMGFQGIFPMNKHEIYRAIFENLTGLFLAPKIFRKEMDNIFIIFLCTLLKMF